MNLEFEKYKRIYWRKRKPLSKKDLTFLGGLKYVIVERNSGNSSTYYPTTHVPEKTMEKLGKYFFILVQKHWNSGDRGNRWFVVITTLKDTYEKQSLLIEECDAIVNSILYGQGEEVDLKSFARTDVGIGRDWRKEHGLL